MEPMEPNIEQIEQKMSKLFCCIKCDYTTSRKLNYDRHTLTDKHKNKAVEPKPCSMEPNIEQIEQNQKFNCICGRQYTYSRGLSKHKKTCSYQFKQNIIRLFIKTTISLLSHHLILEQCQSFRVYIKAFHWTILQHKTIKARSDQRTMFQ